MTTPRALVTGGARRVGRATCLALARNGCAVDLTYRTSNEEALDLTAQLRGLGVEAETFPADLEDEQSVRALASRYGPSERSLDILVHNGSIYGSTPLTDLTSDEALRFFRINALGPLLLTAGLADALRASEMPGGGAVVAMCDIHAMGRPRTGFSAYGMSKAALAEMVNVLARELAPSVRVNGVAPGVVAFPESGYESDEQAQQRYLSRVPLERSGTPEDAAETVCWLALHAHYTTGQVIRVDGGRWLT